MTTMTQMQPSLVSDQVEMLHQVAAVLQTHPSGQAVRLMFLPTGLDLADDEILIQLADPHRRVVELHPRKLADLTPDDVIHASQLLNPGDTDALTYAGSLQGETYISTYGCRACTHCIT